MHATRCGRGRRPALSAAEQARYPPAPDRHGAHTTRSLHVLTLFPHSLAEPLPYGLRHPPGLLNKGLQGRLRGPQSIFCQAAATVVPKRSVR
jgi:hypothetical protein